MARFVLACAILVATAFLNPSHAWSISIHQHGRHPATAPQKNLFRSRSWSHPSSDLNRLSSSASSASTTTTSLPSISLYNSKTRQKEPLLPLVPGKISMYTCGPTVYDSAHVGNFRAFLTYDVLKRVLQYFGYDVTHICNLTDIDDKIIQRCERDQVDLPTLTRRYEQAFRDDLTALNIVPAQRYPRATEHIDEMVTMILQLEQNGLAYQTSDGSWYFHTANMPGYGQQLVQLNVEDMESAQDRNESEEKRNFQDFCLWKAFKPGVDREDATWDSPALGKGRPGWHLECSAMAKKYLGDTIDVHCGGIDLKFPHHENEIAQSEGASGKPFCNCWIHNGFVNINDEKMSKSKGNFLTLRKACPKADDVRAYRYLVVGSQYRNPLSFTEQAMNGAKAALKRMDKVANDIEDMVKTGESVGAYAGGSEIVGKVVPEQLQNFEAALLDDLSMPRAAASLFALVKAAEAELKRVKKNDVIVDLDVQGLIAIQDAMKQMDQVFGVFYKVPMTDDEKEEMVANGGGVPDEVLELVGQRTAAKEAKEWEMADMLRARITELGFKVKDVKDGQPIVSRLE